MVVIQYENDFVLAIGALAANDAVNGQTKIDSTRLNGFRIAKVKIVATLRGKTASEGPLLWGLCCNMNAAELEAAIEADPQSSVADNDKGEGQWLSILGMIPFGMTAGPLTSTGGAIAGAAAHMDDHKVNWSVIEGKTFDLFVYNMEGSAVTTGGIIEAAMEIFGVWLRD